MKEGVQEAMLEKKRILTEIQNMLINIKNMSLVDYIDHLDKMVKAKIEEEEKEKEEKEKEKK